MGASLSPMMTHYVEVKEQNSRGLLFYRVGDFYELFFDDARRAAELLDLTCTSRQNHGGEPIPMAGVPHHALQTYVDRCLAQGVSAVICDQLEDAALAKGMVKRGVTRIETPGTVVQEDQPDQVFLAAIAPPERAKDRWGLALLDLGCADFRCSDFGSLEETLEEVRRFDAKELIFPEDLEFQASAFQGALVPLDRGWFRRKGSAEQIQDFLSVHDLAAFGLSDRPDRVAAAAAASRYARSTRSGEFNHIHVLKSYERSDRLHLDGATLRNLEVFFTLSGQRDGGLLKTLDRCATPGGKRALAESLRAPLLNPTEIEARLDRCEVLLRDHGLRSAVRDHLRRVGDLERIASRLALGGGNPRQLRVLANGLNSLPELAILLQSSETMHQWFMSKWQPLESDLRPLAVELNLALVERPLFVGAMEIVLPTAMILNSTKPAIWLATAQKRSNPLQRLRSKPLGYRPSRSNKTKSLVTLSKSAIATLTRFQSIIVASKPSRRVNATSTMSWMDWPKGSRPLKRKAMRSKPNFFML